MNNTVEFVDSWGCKHTLTLGGAAEELKAFYDAWPGGLEEIESAVRAERQAQVIDAFGKGANQGWNEAVEAVGLKFDAVGNDGMNSYLHRDWAFHFAASARSLKRPLQAQEPQELSMSMFANRADYERARNAQDQASPAAQSGAVEDLVQCEDCSGYGLIGEFTSHDYNERVCDTCACTGKVPRAQTAPAVSLSSVDLASDERALLQKAAQVISWHSFGECRAFGDGPIPEPSEVVGQIKEVLSRTAPAPVSEQPAFPERDPSKPAEQQGMFRKFAVHRVDGSDQPGGKHHGCRYFVLDLDHDPAAPAGMRGYAAEIRATHPKLADDIEAEFCKQPAAQTAGVPVELKLRNILANFHRNSPHPADSGDVEAAIAAIKRAFAAAPQPVAEQVGEEIRLIRAGLRAATEAIRWAELHTGETTADKYVQDAKKALPLAVTAIGELAGFLAHPQAAQAKESGNE